MEEKLSGIVLSAISFGENDKILNIFTLEKGLVSAKIKGVKKAGAKLKFATEPFCFVEYVFSARGNLKTVIGASLIDSFYPIRENIEKYFSAGAVTEFIKRFTREGIVSQTLFMLMIDALKELAYGDETAQSVLVKFLLGALKETGYSLNLSGCFKCGNEISGRTFFIASYGGFECENCYEKGDKEINLSTYEYLRRAENGEKLSKEEGVRCLRLLNYYLNEKPEENLKSLVELIKLSN